MRILTTAASTWSPWLSLLKISRPPFWIIWITPLIFGYVSSAQESGGHYLVWFVVTAAFGAVIESANCIHNELVDQEEDAINQPNRMVLLRSLGQAAAKKLVIAGYVATAGLIIAIALFAEPLVAAMMALGAIAAPLYNWGPRFKRRPGLAELDIGWAVFFSYLSGWAWNAPPWTASPAVFVLVFFFGIMSFVKDLPDVAGDEAVDAASVFSIPAGTLRRLSLLFIYLSPYLLLGCLIVTGVLPASFLVVMVLLLPGIAVAVLGEKGVDSVETMIVAYELAFTYVHVFFLLLLFLVTPSLLAAIVAAVLFLARIGALMARLDPRLVEPGFTWRSSTRALIDRTRGAWTGTV